MPNWPLSQEIRDHLKARATNLAKRAVDLACLNFPLDVQQIQEGAAGLTTKQIDLIKQLKAEGLETIGMTQHLRVGFLRELFPELRRGVILTMALPEAVYVRHTRFGGYRTAKEDFQLNTMSHLLARLDALTPEARTKLITWLEKYLKQARMFEITRACIDAMLNAEVSPTAGHLKHRWPTLTTVIDPEAASPRHYRNSAEVARLSTWVERFRNPPMRGLSRYAGEEEFMKKWENLLKIADLQITAGMLMGKDVSLDKPSVIYPAIDNWERIEGDIIFPLA